MTELPDRQLIAPVPQGMVARLRTALALDLPQSAGGDAIGFGIRSLDAALGGGLVLGALHEVAAVREAEIPAASGFALILAARSQGPVVWIAEDMALAESGVPYGPGLEELGLAPERLIFVQAAKLRDVLWAMEEAIRLSGHRAAGAVVGEIRGGIDPTATRRLSLAAGHSRTLALLLRSTPPNEPSAAVTRFLVGAVRSVPHGTSAMAFGPGPPRFCVRVLRNRRGPLGTWMLEFDRVEQRFAPADREPVAQTALDRPRRALTLLCRGRVAAEGGGVG